MQVGLSESCRVFVYDHHNAGLAAVDGVALGAAVREGDSNLGLLVFVAIMLHKVG